MTHSRVTRIYTYTPTFWEIVLQSLKIGVKGVLSLPSLLVYSITALLYILGAGLYYLIYTFIKWLI